MKAKPYYPNLEDSLRRNGILKKDIAKLLGLTRVSISQKFSGKSDFRLSEARTIKEYIEKVSETKYSFDYLFEIK